MFRKSSLAILMALTVLCGLLVAAPGHAGEDETPAAIDLSPELLGLLRAEMAQLSVGVQGIALAIASADWKAIEETSEKIHGSYLMKQSLTEDQAAELKRKLPDEFKQLDAAFHVRAKRLGHAAAAKDVELVVFHYSRLIESCAGCHANFARDRFPAFEPAAEARHEH